MNTVPNLQQTRRYRRIILSLQILLGTILLGMIAIAGTSLFGVTDFLFAPTPTLTATPAARLTATPDFRAQLLAEDRATQDAYRTLVAESGGAISPLLLPTMLTPKPVETVAILLPNVVVAPVASDTPALPAEGNTNITSTGSIIRLPSVINNVPTPPDPSVPTVTPTPTDTPLPIETPLETATETPTETPIETPTETPLPTDTPAPEQPAATPTPFFVQELRAFVTATAGATVYIGPSTRYTHTGSVTYNAELRLNYRDETGEWVAACCVNGATYWLYQADAPPRDNGLQQGAPPGADANDVRWLPILQAPPTTEPILTPTAIPGNTYPFYRVHRTNNALVPALPKPALTQIWPEPFQVGSLGTPLLVTTQFVIVAGSNDSHLYGLGLAEGNQQRSFDIPQPIIYSPVAQENTVYFVDSAGGAYAVNFDANPPAQIWNVALEGPARSPLYLVGNRLFVAIQGAAQRQIIALDRVNSGTVYAQHYNATDQLYPAFAVGNQLLYIGDPGLRAIDTIHFGVVWQQPEISAITAPPVYVTHGPFALAELYVTDNQNRLLILDANTGRIIRSANIGIQATGLAVDATTVYMTANGTILGWDRQNNVQRWRIGIQGTPKDGPIIDTTRVLVVTDSGSIRLFDTNGVDVFSTDMGGVQAVAGPAVNGQTLYIPASDGKVHAFQGQP